MQQLDGRERLKLFRAAFLESENTDTELLTAAVGAAKVDSEPVFDYLEHEDPHVAGRALYVLVHVPDAALRAVRQALRHHQPDVRFDALCYSEPYRDDAAIQEAVVDIIVSDPSGSVRQNAIRHFRSVFRKSSNSDVRGRLVTRLTTRLGKYEPRSLRLIIELLGEIAEPGDRSVMDPLVSLYENPDSLPAKKRDSMMIRLEFALANLGDDRAFAQFAETVESAPVDERLARLELLDHFRPAPQTLKWVSRLLEDESEIQNVAPAHLSAKIFRKTRDFAVSALGYWFDDFPVKTRGRRTYESDEVERAREWLDQRLKANEGP